MEEITYSLFYSMVEPAGICKYGFMVEITYSLFYSMVEPGSVNMDSWKKSLTHYFTVWLSRDL